MNSTKSLTDEEFEQIVIREVKRQATLEEISYLQEHLIEWRACLVALLHAVEGNKTHFQQKMSEDTWNEHRFELESKITNIKKFTRVIQGRLAKLNSVIKSSNLEREKQRHATLREDRMHLEPNKHDAYFKGWGDAIRYFDELMKDGLTQGEAFLACIEHAKSEVRRKQE